MLTPAQEKYLLTIPEDKKVMVQKYDPRTSQIVEGIIQQIKLVEPNLEIKFMGASALGISGQGDLDIYVFSPRSEFDQHRENLEKVFGKPAINGTSVKWEFTKEGHNVELYITDPSDKALQEQVKIFEILKSNKDLLKEYEALKENAKDLSFREYQRRKYEFYNRLLNE